MCILWTESENIGRSFTISGHGVRGQGLSPMHRGYISSASKFWFSSFSYSHSPRSIIEKLSLIFRWVWCLTEGNLLGIQRIISFLLFFGLFFYLFTRVPTFPKKTIIWSDVKSSGKTGLGYVSHNYEVGRFEEHFQRMIFWSSTEASKGPRGSEWLQREVYKGVDQGVSDEMGNKVTN